MAAIRLRLRTENSESERDYKHEPDTVVRNKTASKVSKLPAAGDLLRDRRRRSPADLHEVWSSKNIEDHIEVDPFDERISKLSDSFRRVSKRSTRFMASRKSAPTRPRITEKKADRPSANTNGVPLFNAHASSLDIVPARPKSQPAPKSKTKPFRFFMNAAQGMRSIRLKPSKKLIVVTLGCLVVVGVAQVVLANTSKQPAQDKENQDKAALGANVSSRTIPNNERSAGPTVVTSTEFPLLIPSDTTRNALEVVLVSPPDNAPVYAYLDTYEGVELRISQQQLPEELRDDVDTKLAEVAKDFQASDIIQIDDMTVYHGFTERFGGVQSLVFVKNDVMVFISSAAKLSDDSWAGYILSLN